MGTHDAIQMIQDTDISKPAAFANSAGVTIITGAEVANGATAAFNQVLNLKPASQQTLEAYLTSQDWSTASVLITGHSLGGTVASMLAPWLASVMAQAPLTNPLPSNLQAVTFAAFAAGNVEFADYLSNSPQYQPNINTNDIVPYVWATQGPYPVGNIFTTFASPGTAMPATLQAKLLKKAGTIPVGFNYIQTTEPSTFTGAIVAPPSFSDCNLSAEKVQEAQWNWEVSVQHNYAYCVQYIQSGCTLPSSDCPKS
jgi:hypothetical protein